VRLRPGVRRPPAPTSIVICVISRTRMKAKDKMVSPVSPRRRWSLPNGTELLRQRPQAVGLRPPVHRSGVSLNSVPLGVVRIIAIIGVLLAAVAGFFAWANSQTRPAYARSTRSDVEEALKEFVSPTSADHDQWDLFLGWPIDDPYLESIRQRCQAFAGHDADPAAKDHVRAILAELRAHT